jgi:hypothetical protein
MINRIQKTLTQQFEELQQLRDRVRGAEAKAVRAYGSIRVVDKKKATGPLSLRRDGRVQHRDNKFEIF